MVDAIENLQKEVDIYSNGLGIIDDNFTSNLTVEELFGSNLLCILFGPDSPLKQNDSGNNKSSAIKTRQRSIEFKRQTSECFVNSEDSEEIEDNLQNKNDNIKLN